MQSGSVIVNSSSISGLILFVNNWKSDIRKLEEDFSNNYDAMK